jgi:hypothetical protein
VPIVENPLQKHELYTKMRNCRPNPKFGSLYNTNNFRVSSSAEASDEHLSGKQARRVMVIESDPSPGLQVGMKPRSLCD